MPNERAFLAAIVASGIAGNPELAEKANTVGPISAKIARMSLSIVDAIIDATKPEVATVGSNSGPTAHRINLDDEP